jgi:hypothetical protein
MLKYDVIKFLMILISIADLGLYWPLFSLFAALIDVGIFGR